MVVLSGLKARLWSQPMASTFAVAAGYRQAVQAAGRQQRQDQQAEHRQRQQWAHHGLAERESRPLTQALEAGGPDMPDIPAG